MNTYNPKTLLARLMVVRLVVLAMFATAAITTMSVATADDYGAPATASVDIAKTMKKARAYIDSGKLKKATKQLEKVVAEDKSHADAWNLLGYSWRKMDKNKKSMNAYAKALKIDPNHRGALEYQGELFIKIGKLDKAKGNLVKLKSLCPSGCDELDNLTKALAGNSDY